LKHGIQNLLRHFVRMWSKFDPYDGREGAAVDPLRVLAIDTTLEACSARSSTPTAGTG